MWKNYGRAGQATDDNIIRRMRLACWITKATETLRISNTHCFSTATMVTRTRLNITFIRTLPVLFVRNFRSCYLLNFVIFTDFELLDADVLGCDNVQFGG